MRSASSYANVYTYTGRQLDTETGLHYFRARFFAAQLGRFCGRDPVEYVDGYSMYLAAFVPNDLDPFGQQRSRPGDWGNPFVLPPLPRLEVPDLAKEIEKLRELIAKKTVEVCKAECKAWIEWDTNLGDDWLKKLPKCPCNQSEATATKWKKFPTDRNTHPGCTTCFRSRPTILPPDLLQPGQQCCYDDKGHLITCRTRSGTVDRRNPGINLGGHLYWDVYPYLVCKKAECSMGISLVAQMIRAKTKRETPARRIQPRLHNWTESCLHPSHTDGLRSRFFFAWYR